MTKVYNAITDTAFRAVFKSLLLLLALMGTVAVTNAQAYNLKQKVTINYKSTTAAAVIGGLNKQTKVSFTYEKAILENVKIPAIKFNNTSLNAVLDFLHQGY
jgi:hypothetical protein